MASVNFITAATGPITLQQAADIQPLFPTIYPAACLGNCTEVCQQPAAVWASMQTLTNCLAYPFVSELLSSDQLEPETVQSVLELGFLPHIRGPTDAVKGCVWKTCQESDCTIHRNDRTAGVTGSASRHDDNFMDKTLPPGFVDRACETFASTPNVDIGGVGVYIAYLIQLGILIYAYIHTRLMSTWVRQVTFLATLPFKGAKSARAKAQTAQQNLDNTRQQAALLTGLVEFQKAQAFFATVIAATTISALATNGSLLAATSIPQLHLTIDLLRDVAALGILSLTFGVYLLHSGGKHSLYVTALSATAALICAIAWLLCCIRRAHAHALTIAPSGLAGPRECGGFSPGAFCSPAAQSQTLVIEALLLAICVASLAGVLARLRDVAGARRLACGWHLEMAETVYAGLAALMMGVFTTNGELEAVRREARWTLAQLLGVTLWVPCLVEYGYAATRGLVNSMEHRMAPGYRVVGKKGEEDEEE